MSSLGPHAGFILGSYAACAVIIVALAVWIIRDNRARSREIEAIDTRRGTDAKP